MERVSTTYFFIAKPIDWLLCADETTVGGWMQKNLAARVIASALFIFAVIDASGHLFIGMGKFVQYSVKFQINHGVSMLKLHFVQSIKFIVLSILTPIEVISPDTLTQPLINQAHLEETYVKNDVSGLNPTKVFKSYRPKTEEDLKATLKEAEENNWKITLGGQLHSQGGHQFYPGGIYIDMRCMDKILGFDPNARTIRVQPGMTWGRIQEHIHPYGLAIQSMQASNIFTIGGSLSTNVHGWDHKSGQLIETVKEIRVLMADGTIKKASRTENPELFSLAIGGYGLMGIILDATIELTDNAEYRKTAKELRLHNYPQFFEEHILKDPSIGLHYARLSLNNNDLFGKVIAVNYRETAKKQELLKEEEHIERNQFFFHVYRRHPFVRKIRWPLEVRRERQGEILCRNNAMRPEIEFLTYSCPRDTDILQEYFIPKQYFTEFTKELAKIVSENNVNLLNVTVRFVKGCDRSFLSYAKEDSFAFVLYINHETSKDGIDNAKKWTREMTEAALNYGGNFYLPYQQYQTDAQFQRGYPEFETFLEKKQVYDPKSRFVSSFFETCRARCGAGIKANCA